MERMTQRFKELQRRFSGLWDINAQILKENDDMHGEIEREHAIGGLELQAQARPAPEAAEEVPGSSEHEESGRRARFAISNCRL